MTVLRRTLWLILSMLSAFSMWYYVANVWSFGQPAQFSDLYARWWGARELLLHRRDPYSPAVTREIQIVIYGAPVQSLYPGDEAELAGGFAYPVYVVFLMWPTVHWIFPEARTLFLCLFVAVTLVSLLLWLYSLKWRPPAATLVVLAVFTFGSFPVLQGLKLQNLSMVVAFLIAATIASFAAEHYAMGGLLLASATIKPQFVVLLIPWLTLWTIADWRRRQRWVWSFSAGMAVLVLSGEAIAPGWVRRFINVARAYRRYTFGHSLLDVWLSPLIGPIVATAVVLMVLAVCWRRRSTPAQSSGFFLVSSWVLAVTLLVIPTLEPHAQLLLLPGILFLLRYGGCIWRTGKMARLLFTAAWVLLGWAWVAAFAMMLASIWIPAATLRRLWELPLYTSPLIPLGIFVILGFLLVKEGEQPSFAL